MASLYCALLHHPVKDRAGQIVTTAITNLDVHDIARSARTYGLAGYFVVTPITAQRALVERILEHWRTGGGRQRIPERGEALSLVDCVADLEQCLSSIEAREGQRPLTVATAARPPQGRAQTSFEALAAEIEQVDRPVLLLFGTGHGLAGELLEGCDRLLSPIQPRPIPGQSHYNHLSVRSAAAIAFDRLRGADRPTSP